MGPSIHLAVPHLFEPVPAPEWMTQLFLSVVAVYFMDKWADKIPGVGGINYVPQAFTLVSIATAVSTLFDIPLIGSFILRLGELSDRMATGMSLLWNIGGIMITLGIAVWLGLKYMTSEEIFWHGILFGVAVGVGSFVVPWMADALEFWRYSGFTGIRNVFVISLDWLANLSIEKATPRP